MPKQNELPKVQSANIEPTKIIVTDVESSKNKKAKKTEKTEKIDFKEAVGMNKRKKV